MKILRYMIYGIWALLLWFDLSLALNERAEGFGANTPGGAGKPVYRVTNLNDSGPGSFRDAVSRGNRHVVFGGAGVIALKSNIQVLGAFITIDGLTAAPPGVTLKFAGLVINGDKGAHDVIVRGIRVREAKPHDICVPDVKGGISFMVTRRAYNVVLDHVSAALSGDGAASVSRGAYNVTISNSIFGPNAYPKCDNSLFGVFGPQGNPPNTADNTRRVTIYRNFFIGGSSRLPRVTWSKIAGQHAPEIMADVRGNLIWQYGPTATGVIKGAKANVVGNYYYNSSADTNTQKRAIFFCHEGSVKPQCEGKSNDACCARAYIAGNISGAGKEVTDYLNSLGTESLPFPMPPITTTDACVGAHRVLQSGGVRPLDDMDQKYFSLISLPSCGDATGN
jgi:pectate lyase